jgi:hypothetical protein
MRIFVASGLDIRLILKYLLFELQVGFISQNEDDFEDETIQYKIFLEKILIICFKSLILFN